MLRFIAGFMLTIALSAGPAAAADRAVKATLLVFSDIYEMGEKGGRGGFARVAGAIAAERAKGHTVIATHAGDTLSPSLMSSFDQGAHIVDLLNRMTLDVFVPGNHEFDFGEAVFRKRMGEATFPLLAANLRDEAGAALPGFADSKIIEVDGVKIGIMGLTDDESAKRSQPGSLKLAPTIPTAKTMTDALRKDGADIIVAVSHSAWQDDLRLMNLGIIDVILSGHDHNLLVAHDGRSAIAETQADGVNVVAVDLDITVSEGEARKVSWRPSFRVIDTSTVTPDANVAAAVAAYEATLSKDLDSVVGTTTTALDSRKASVRGGETAIGNYFADAILAALKADVAIINGGGIRGDREYPAGTALSRRDVFKELPFGNKAVLVAMTGADLTEILENAVRTIGKGDGRFGQIAGARITGRKDAVPGQKLSKIEIGGVPLDPAKIYKVATNDFLAQGKDGYDAFQRGTVMVTGNEGPLLVSVVLDALKAAGSIAPAIDGRIAME